MAVTQAVAVYRNNVLTGFYHSDVSVPVYTAEPVTLSTEIDIPTDGNISVEIFYVDSLETLNKLSDTIVLTIRGEMETARAMIEAVCDVIDGNDLMPENTSYFTDGVHPNVVGNKLMAENIKSKIE